MLIFGYACALVVHVPNHGAIVVVNLHPVGVVVQSFAVEALTGENFLHLVGLGMLVGATPYPSVAILL